MDNPHKEPTPSKSEVYKEYAGLFSSVAELTARLEAVEPKQEIEDEFRFEILDTSFTYIPENISAAIGTPDSISVLIAVTDNESTASISLDFHTADMTAVISRVGNASELDSQAPDGLIDHLTGEVFSIPKVGDKEVNRCVFSLLYPDDLPNEDLIANANLTDPRVSLPLREMMAFSALSTTNRNEYIFKSSDTLFNYSSRTDGSMDFNVRYSDQDEGWIVFVEGMYTGTKMHIDFSRIELETDYFDPNQTKQVKIGFSPSSEDFNKLKKTLLQESAALEYSVATNPIDLAEAHMTDDKLEQFEIEQRADKAKEDDKKFDGIILNDMLSDSSSPSTSQDPDNEI